MNSETVTEYIVIQFVQSLEALQNRPNVIKEVFNLQNKYYLFPEFMNIVYPVLSARMEKYKVKWEQSRLVSQPNGIRGG